MNHEIALRLELLDHTAARLRFGLTVENRSAVKLLLPFPEITGLRFGNLKTVDEAEWYTFLFVSSAAGGITLTPGESRTFDWRARPHDVEPPEDGGSGPAGVDDFQLPPADFDYHRWCVELTPGDYLVWFRWRVDRDFFDPDSHLTLRGLEALAASEGAEAWTGEALSNRLRLTHPPA